MKYNKYKNNVNYMFINENGSILSELLMVNGKPLYQVNSF